MISIRFVRPIIVSICCICAINPAMVRAQKAGYEIRPMVFPIEFVECYDDENEPHCEVYFATTDIGFAKEKSTVHFKPSHAAGITNAPVMAVQLSDDHYGEVAAVVPTEIGKLLNNQFLAMVDFIALTPNYAGIMTGLADKSIIFTDVEENKYYDQSLVFTTDCPSWEAMVWKNMAEDIRITASTMRGKMEEPVVKGNLFDGKQLFDAMEATQADDVRLFLSYVAMRPAIYMGKPLKISETYATWLVEGAPMPVKGVIEELRAAKRAKDLTKFTQVVSGLQLHELSEVVRYLIYQGEKQMKSGDKDESLVSIVLAEELAVAAEGRERLPRTADLHPWVTLHAGLWELQFGDLDKALSRFKVAKKESAGLDRAFIEVASICGEVQALGKKSEFKKVLKTAEKGINKTHWAADESSDLVREFTDFMIGKMYFEMAKAKLALGEKENAQGFCWDGLDYADPLSSVDGLVLQAEYYKLLPSCLSEEELEGGQGEEYKQRAAEIARRIEEVKSGVSAD